MKSEFKRVSAKGSLSLTSKLGEREGIIGEGTSVKALLEKDPLRLWHLIHAPESKISLVKPTYFKLKDIIRKIAPHLVEKNDKVSQKHRILRRIAKEKHIGVFGTEKSSFRSLGKYQDSEGKS